jgi:hypothetical protein
MQGTGVGFPGTITPVFGIPVKSPAIRTELEKWGNVRIADKPPTMAD